MSAQKRGARAHGHLISAVGMIGSAAMQIKARAKTAPMASQADKVMRWSDECAGALLHFLSDTTVRKMEKHGKAFVDHCVAQGIVSRKDSDTMAVIYARLLSGWYAVNTDLYCMGLRGPWLRVNQTAGTLLAMLHDQRPEMEGPAFAVAEKMEMELRS